jgi:predicted methyltransferase
MRVWMSASLTLLATAGLSAAATGAPSIPQAVAATSGRSAVNVARDAGRKPAQVLRFLGLRPGMQVLDMVGGNGYWSEIIAPAVGPRGRVTIWQPTQFYSQKVLDGFTAGVGRNGNVGLITSPWEAPDLGTAQYDFLLINLDYHDVYYVNPKRKLPRQEPGPWLARVNAALKPGAIVGVIDHIAVAGADARDSVDEYHRIDPAVVRADWEAAGFKLEAQSDVLRNPADPHNVLVFDPSISGHTDRFLFRFRKVR